NVEGSPVLLSIHDATGRLVRTLVDGPSSAGMHTISWDGTDPSGRSVTSGIYFYQLRAGGKQITKRMLRME
ncbi:MAG: T9SS type A sorting domain-containing protein, partial [Candidatus Eisenbacteria sp.]|nr:T9SS type A sorting domain-containing protein [Candidatus Eisenbacteria bacterium]